MKNTKCLKGTFCIPIWFSIETRSQFIFIPRFATSNIFSVQTIVEKAYVKTIQNIMPSALWWFLFCFLLIIKKCDSGVRALLFRNVFFIFRFNIFNAPVCALLISFLCTLLSRVRLLFLFFNLFKSRTVVVGLSFDSR